MWEVPNQFGPGFGVNVHVETYGGGCWYKFYPTAPAPPALPPPPPATGTKSYSLTCKKIVPWTGIIFYEGVIPPLNGVLETIENPVQGLKPFTVVMEVPGKGYVTIAPGKASSDYKGFSLKTGPMFAFVLTKIDPYTGKYVAPNPSELPSSWDVTITYK